jgi:uncharacterized protein
MHNFTPLASLIGGLLIGSAASAMLWLDGKIAGISGILGGLLQPVRGDALWRACFVVGLFAAGLIMRILNPAAYAFTISRSTGAIIVAGLLVGFGTRLGSGCTSGHGVCGVSRISARSLLATATFLVTGAATVFLINHLFGGRI